MLVAGLVGARLYYLAVNDAAALLRPADWVGRGGFAIYGALIAATAAGLLYGWRHRLDFRYLDSLAVGFPLGLAVGRVGDLINGEHYGPASSLPWAVRHPHPDALVPSPTVAYHDGGLYEIVLGLVLAVAVWRAAGPATPPGDPSLDGPRSLRHRPGGDVLLPRRQQPGAVRSRRGASGEPGAPRSRDHGGRVVIAAARRSIRRIGSSLLTPRRCKPTLYL
jgi:hypothetical protein